MEAKLLADLTKAKAACRAIHLDLEKLRQRQQRRRFTGFTNEQRRTALVLYDMYEFTTAGAVMYLKKQYSSKEEGIAIFSDDELSTLAEHWVSLLYRSRRCFSVGANISWGSSNL